MSDPPPTARSDTLTIFVTLEDRRLIDRAARLSGKTTVDFVLDAGRRAAEEAVLDQTSFVVGSEVFEAFRARLDEPQRPNNRLRRTLQTAAVWE